MNVGEKIEGYFLGTKQGVSKNPKWKPPTVLVFQTEDGRTVDAYASGSLNYLEDNAAKDPTLAMVIGQYTVVQKTGSYKNKAGRDFPTFSVQQDDAKVLTAGASQVSAAAATPSVQDRLARIRQG